MSALPGELRDLIESGPMAHLSTINPDGSPQVTVIWVGLDGDDLVSGHMSRNVKLRNMERDPRVVLSFDGPRVAGAFLNEYAVLQARYDATVTLDVPTLLIHGMEDYCVLPETTDGAGRHFTNSYRRILLEGVGHFPQREQPGTVANAILQHLWEPKA